MRFFERLKHSRIYLYLSGIVNNFQECLLGGWHYLKLLFGKVPEKTVLLAEPNAFHGECLPGYVKYFRELGYKIVILCRYVNYKEDPFCRFAEKPTRYCLTIWGMRKYLRSRKVKNYEYILLTSARSYMNEYRYYWRYPDFLKMLPEGKCGVGLIEHEFGADSYGEFWNKQSADSKYLKELFEHTFVLTGFSYKGREIPMLNPHYFGDIKPKQTLSEGKRIFITVGKISDNTRNYSQLFEALLNLPDNMDYEIRVIGSGTLDGVPEKLRSKFKILGRLNFEDMYRDLEEADFFLPLLDPEKQCAYLKYCTTGSRQLILGFNMISLMQKEFVEHYGFSSDNTIVYDHDLSGTIMQALTMTNEEYLQMKMNLEKVRKAVDAVSSNNLKKRLQ
ncbi:MAG: hypothetical protein E7040_00125 [Lentisphaerae bacterium]|nr:hypothetical protein [Lentisphaerota bacterium]